jgi:hypothetical protein
MKIYRIYPVGPIPADLRDRVSAIHATAVLKTKGEGDSAIIQASNGSNKKSIPRSIRRVNKKSPDQSGIR